MTAPSSPLEAEIQKWRELLDELRSETDKRPRPKLTVIRGGRDAS